MAHDVDRLGWCRTVCRGSLQAQAAVVWGVRHSSPIMIGLIRTQRKSFWWRSADVLLSDVLHDFLFLDVFLYEVCGLQWETPYSCYLVVVNAMGQSSRMKTSVIPLVLVIKWCSVLGLPVPQYTMEMCAEDCQSPQWEWCFMAVGDISFPWMNCASYSGNILTILFPRSSTATYFVFSISSRPHLKHVHRSPWVPDSLRPTTVVSSEQNSIIAGTAQRSVI